MKKSIILGALALMTAVAMTSCKDDTQPRLQPAAEGTFKLFEPANNNYTYDLTDPNFTMTLTTSGQPDYGLATPTSYQVQISLDNTWEEEVVDPETEEVVKYGTCYNLSTVNTQSVITVLSQEINYAITYLQGVYDEDMVDKYDPSVCSIYARVRAYVADPGAPNGYVPYSQVYSNSVKINKVQPSYTATLPVPGVLYMIGAYQKWDINGNAYTRTVTEAENGIGSKIYTGYLYLDAADIATYYDTAYPYQFRFYRELGDWEHNSVGAQVDDNPIQVDLTMQDGVLMYSGACVDGKGSWEINNVPAGGAWFKITVDLKAMKVEFAVDEEYSE